MGSEFLGHICPVVSWSSVRILMTLSRLHNLHTKSVDFVQAYPQAIFKSIIHLFPPAGIILNQENEEMVLKLLKNIYGLKDAGLTWFERLSKGLDEMVFKLMASDSCIVKNGSNIVVLYVDDCITLSRTKEEADIIFIDLHNKGYKMTDEGTMKEYLGILFINNSDGSFRMS